MLRIIKKENIIENGMIQGNIQGELIKLYFYCKYPNVLVQVETQDREVIWQGNLNQEHLNIYPRKMINILDETKIEKYHLLPDSLDQNNLFIRITGLNEGERIDKMKVLYEYDQIIHTSD